MALESNEALLRMEYLTANISTLPHVSDEWEMDVKMAAAASFIAAGAMPAGWKRPGQTLAQPLWCRGAKT